jgi:peptide/nickel transport system substrate-binding protein
LNIRVYIVTFLLVFLSILRSQAPLQPAESFGDNLIIGQVGDPPAYLNPFQVNTVLEKQLVRLVFGTGLIQRMDRFGQPPILIDRFIQPPRKLQGYLWQYSIIRNIDYHNGIPMRNNDIRFTFEVLKKFGGNILNKPFAVANIDSIGTSGDLEFTFFLKEKNNFFDQDLSDIPILSEQYYKNLQNVGYDLFSVTRPLGYGPFILESRAPRLISLIPHPNYPFGKPFLNRVIYRFFDDEQEMIDEFIQGKLDLIEVNESETARRLHQVLNNEIKIFQIPRPEKKVFFILLNVNRFPFDNSRVRLAVRGSINQNEIIRELADQNSHIAYSIIDYTNSLFYKELFQENYEPDVSLSNLQNDGWHLNSPRGILERDGRNLNFELLFEENSHLEESIARSIKIHLAELGINVQPRPVNYRDKELLIEDNNFTAAVRSYTYYDDNLYNVIKDFYFTELKKEGYVINYSNPLIERLFSQADRRPQLQKQVISRFQIFLHQNAPAVFLYFDDKIIYAVSTRFQNMRVSYSSDNKVYYYRLMPFENWFVPKNLQKYPSR